MSSIQTSVLTPAHAWTTTSGRVLGTRFELAIDGDSSLIDLALDRFRRLEAALSRLLPMSELNRLNARPGQDVPVSDDLGCALREAVRLRLVTGGRFDPSILPTSEGLGLVLGDDDTARLNHGTRLDLSGIEAGLAIDAVVEALIDAGVRAVRLRVGDTFRAVGPDQWTIEVAHPATGEIVTHQTLTDRSLTAVVTPRLGPYATTPYAGASDQSTVVSLAVVACSRATDAQGAAQAAVASSPGGANALMTRLAVDAWLLTPVGVVVVRSS